MNDDTRRDASLVWVRPDEQCVALAEGFRLNQKRKGHRYSSDDMLVGHRACVASSSPRRVLDLGCGIGSVLLMVAWANRQASFVGVEAQPEHVALANANVVLNGCAGRVRIVPGDLRDKDLIRSLGTFDLVTGSPPYFDPARGTVCANPQRAYAQWELRGGIEDYARAAAVALAPDGLFVACSGAEPVERGQDAVRAAGLHLHWWQVIVPRPKGAPFLTLFVAGKQPLPGGVFINAPDLLMRNADGTRTEEHIHIREWFGVPCSLR